MKQRIVIALGGNALGNSPEEQLKLVQSTAKNIVDLLEDNNEIVIGHGNGPQVGMINLGLEYAFNNNAGIPNIPFAECGAMSQGYIGYHLQQAITNELNNRGLNQNCASIITQVVVDSNDEAFSNPTKPIGNFYTKEESDEINIKTGYVFMEDAGRGYRRVVPSPEPIQIVEIDSVKSLIEDGNIVITIGGGGIPVVKTEKGYKGISAVIDKDKSSSVLASDIKADYLIILTAVEKVCINFGKPNQIQLDEITVEQAKQYIQEDQFAAGSMLPKIEACLDFLKSNPEGKALITSLDKVKDAINGKTGTKIIN